MASNHPKGTTTKLSLVSDPTNPNDPKRREDALARRIAAAQVAYSRPHPRHEANGDENLDDFVPFNFTKGLPHNPDTGLIQDPDHYEKFVIAINSGRRSDFRKTPLGHEKNKGDHPEHATCSITGGSDSAAKRLEGILALQKRLEKHLGGASDKTKKLSEDIGVRAWESQSAGLAYELEGPDPQSVTMPPAPGISNAPGELAFEMAEVYAQALLRDVPLSVFDEKHTGTIPAGILEIVNYLIDLASKVDLDPDKRGLRHCEDLAINRIFRGLTPGDQKGPYLSQFLLQGTGGVNGNDSLNVPTAQRLTYGAITIDQRVRFALPKCDYMTTWDEWYAVQCAANLGGMELYATELNGVDANEFGYRAMLTGRDLATYVHYDALYEAYLNACLTLIAARAPFDPGIPFQGDDKDDHQQGFAHFGGPHILSLVTEVATRALKAVRFQKFNVHRRFRPEALAARIHKADTMPGLKSVMSEMLGEEPFNHLLAKVVAHNAEQNDGLCHKPSKLLPMAFTEGSPMHPAYGAGHATVAGACVTILKAFFNGDAYYAKKEIPAKKAAGHKYLGKVFTSVVDDGEATPEQKAKGIVSSKLVEGYVSPNKDKEAFLSLEGELNKLAANISIGRDWAGVHFYSDYAESIRMGEEIAIGILEEQKMMFRENYSMKFTRFDGTPFSM